MKILQFIVTMMLITSSVIAQESSTVKVKVTNIDSDEGEILIALFNSEESFLNVPYKSLSKNANTAEVSFEFKGIEEGEYTISVYHDLNSNGKLDKNFIGIPSEPYGISKDGKSSFGPPNYSEAIFKVAKTEVNLTITL